VGTGTPEDVAAGPDRYTGQAQRDGQLSWARLKGGNARKRKQDLPVDLSVVAAGGSPVGRQARSPAATVVEPITHLTVQGAQQHNLKNLTVSLPRENMTVFSGPSGSGKSSLALDTIYAEGQRRYIESLSAYARQFLGQMEKPKVEHV